MIGNKIQNKNFITDHDVYKLYYYYPKWTPGHGDTCYPQIGCWCYEDHEKLEKPLLFNMETDPSEHHPLDVNKPHFQEIVNYIHTATKEHESSFQPVESQFSFGHAIWWPSLQPCCNFPYCTCSDHNNALHRSKLVI